MKFLQALETFGADALKDIELPVTAVDKVFLVLTKGASDAPEVATVIRTLVTKCVTIGADGATAVNADGLNIPDDLKLLGDAKDLYTYVTGTVIPTVEQAFSDITGAVKSPAPAASTKAAVNAGADPAPAKIAVVDGPSTVSNKTVQDQATEEAAGEIRPGPGLHNVTKA